jgi:nitronate monooxygenase
MLTTELTRRFGIEHPIISAGMGGGSGPELAAAVSNAGGLGSLATIAVPPASVGGLIAKTRELTGKPFAVNIVTWDWAPFANEIVDVAIAERPPVVVLSFGDPIPGLRKCQEAGLKTIVQVQDLAGAQAALAAGPDALIVQGNEAGGHTGRRSTLSFAAQVLDMAGDIPIIIAGGVATGRGLAAVLAMGGAGVVMGTRFKATLEFGGEEFHKQAIVGSDGSNTTYNEIVDLARGGRWPNGVTGRVIRNSFVAEWEDKPEELQTIVRSFEKPWAFMAQYENDPEKQLNWAGEASGLVHEILPAAEVVRRTVEEAEGLLARVAGVVAR